MIYLTARLNYFSLFHNPLSNAIYHSLMKFQILRKVGDLVRAETNWLAELETLDTGKPLWEARADIEACADSFELFAGFIPSFVGTHSPVPPNPGR